MYQDSIIGITTADSSPLYAVYQWGLKVIQAIQTMETPVCTAALQMLTQGGTPYFYIPVILFVLWCVDEKQGLRLGILMLLSAWVNGTCKSLLKQPRPYTLDPSVGRGFELSYGIPSGHAQMALTFWIPLALRIRKIPVWIGAILITLLIGFTRLYLGLHFPTDVLAGWLLGGIILGIYYGTQGVLEKALDAGGTRFRMISIALIALGMNAAGSDPSLSGLFLGFGTGYALMRSRFPFSAQAPIRGKQPDSLVLGARYALGIAGAGLVYQGLGAVLSLRVFPYELSRFLHYGAVGFWACAGAPWLFLRLGLGAGTGRTGDKHAGEAGETQDGGWRG
ncbi:MAG: phosphatase PAP2 family protein [Treponema sp.]|jgi:membrane-associated phospholipid phosphatase|nr:phosphatase PAP2 family protein [Treponema sp.]